MRISADYPGRPGVLREAALDVGEGEILGLAGRSGEGKSTIALSILGLVHLKKGVCRGEILFQGRDLLRLTQRELRGLRGRVIGLVPQSPLSALNPNLQLKTQLEEAWRAHARGSRDWRPLLEGVSLPGDAAFLKLYPRNLSVGMAQRFLIAMAVMHEPALLLADEPTSALDTITQSEILGLFRELNRKQGIALLYISHDLASLAALCHRVAILYQGEIVENGPLDRIFQSAAHPYTRQLVAAIPRPAFLLTSFSGRDR
jgi:ABC-type dipeptide/oligopeptide/nickel transport system ATPase component